MPRSRPFAQVDVFASSPYSGNPVAVVLDGQGLDAGQMQQFAAWTNLSETTFVVPPTSSEADYGLRIFTPGGELPFAGHPTLGSAHAWLAGGGAPAAADKVVQECGVGLVDLRREERELRFRAPDLRRSGPLEDDIVQRIAGALGVARDDVVAHQWVDNGPGWAAVQLSSVQQVLDLEPDHSAMSGLMVGVVGFYPEGSAHQLEVRAFAPAVGIREDPVTGSLNAGVAQWLIGAGVMPPAYSASQGQRVGRRGVVAVMSRHGAVWVGGASLTCISGTVRL